MLAIAGYFYYKESSINHPPLVNPGSLDADKVNPSIEEYVKENISTLSPAPEVLGGKFYVTSIEAHGGTGTVSYEDGHNAYTADFTYNIDEKGTPKIETFTIRR